MCKYVSFCVCAWVSWCLLSAELGDFHEDDLQPGYVNEFQFLPQPSQVRPMASCDSRQDDDVQEWSA